MEKAGTVQELVTNKCRVLTHGDMTVSTFFVGVSKSILWNPEISQEILRLIYDCILLNTEAHIEINDDDHRYEPIGSPIEVGMFNYLINNGLAIQDELSRLEKQSQLIFKILGFL